MKKIIFVLLLLLIPTAVSHGTYNITHVFNEIPNGNSIIIEPPQQSSGYETTVTVNGIREIRNGSIRLIGLEEVFILYFPPWEIHEIVLSGTIYKEYTDDSKSNITWCHSVVWENNWYDETTWLSRVKITEDNKSISKLIYDVDYYLDGKLKGNIYKIFHPLMFVNICKLVEKDSIEG